MKGDNSRDTFQRDKHYRHVRMQQGRVQIDADWNELADIFDDLLAEAVGDLVGQNASVGLPALTLGSPPVVTAGVGGFAIAPNVAGTNLEITPGRLYVDGFVAELNPPSTGTKHLFDQQPDLPGVALPTTGGIYVAYLDVWQRHITSVEDPSIREVALGGPDTATRSQTVSQVKLLLATGSPPASECTSPIPAFDQLVSPTSPPQGKMSARAVGATAAATACDVATGGGFTGLQNQLYRVEIHQGGSGIGMTFKWSRDNGAVLFGLAPTANPPSALNPIIVLQSAPPDEARGFSVGQWVELLDDTIELQGRSGLMVKLMNVDGVNLTFDTGNIRNPDGTMYVGAPPSTPLVNLAARAKARRWDHSSTTGVLPLQAGVDATLENGLLINLTGGFYRTGDYWLIPARTAIGTTSGIEWPTSGGVPQLLDPRGIVHHYTRLALVARSVGGVYTLLRDCRRRLPALGTLSSDDIAFKNTSSLILPAAPSPQTVTAALETLSLRTNPPPKVRASVAATTGTQTPANTTFATAFNPINQMSLPNLSLVNVDASGRVPVLIRLYVGGVTVQRQLLLQMVTEAQAEFRIAMTPLASPGSPVFIATSFELYYAFLPPLASPPNAATGNFEARHIFLERFLVGPTNGVVPGTYSFTGEWSIKSPQTFPGGALSVTMQSLTGSTRELMVIEL